MVEVEPIKRIKVVHLQFGTSISGNYTLRQHEAFLEAGIDSSVLSLHSEIKGDPRVQNLGRLAKFLGKTNQRIQNFITRNRKKEYGGFSLSFLGSNVSTHP